MSIHSFPIATRIERRAPRGPTATVYVHPTVSHDIRRAERLERTTGRQIIINDRGEPVLQPVPTLADRLLRAPMRQPAAVALEPVNY